MAAYYKTSINGSNITILLDTDRDDSTYSKQHILDLNFWENECLEYSRGQYSIRVARYDDKVQIGSGRYEIMKEGAVYKKKFNRFGIEYYHCIGEISEYNTPTTTINLDTLI